jgi:hypothetical protein
LFGPVPPGELDEIVDGLYVNALIAQTEDILLFRVRAEEVASLVTVDRGHHLDRALDRGKGCVLLSTHMGFGCSCATCSGAGVARWCESGPRPAEIIEGARHGRLIPVGQADALAHGLIATLDAPGDPAGRRRRAADFSADASVSTYLELFDSLEEPIRS